MQDSTSANKRAILFAPLSRRISAMFVDGVILFCMFVFTAFTVSKMGLPTYLRISIVAVLVIGLEPFFVAFTGASPGHHYRGLRVIRKGSELKLSLLQAFVRFFTKSLLGLYSLIFVFTTRKYQALHDLAAGSVVVLNEASVKKGIAGVSEQDVEEDGYVYPSALRRILIIIPYLFVSLIVLTLIWAPLLSDACFEYRRCSVFEKVIDIAFSIIFVLTWGLIVLKGWRGLLWGAR